MGEINEQVAGGPLKYGGITSLEILKKNLTVNCIPLQLLDNEEMPYEEFLKERRDLMAARMREHFLGLGNVNSET
jgi:hypothetical protein